MIIPLLPLIINTTGLLVGIFCIVVVVYIYLNFQLERLLFFVMTGIFITLWNAMHLVLNLVPATQYSTARFFWSIAILSGYGMILTALIGFHQLKEEHITWRVIGYTIVVTAFITSFFNNPVLLDVAYNKNNGWTTITEVSIGWTLFSIAISLMVAYEVLAPQLWSIIQSPTENRGQILLSLTGILIALSSNLLLPILDVINWPADLRFLIADIWFLLWFGVLRNYPFVGIYDPTNIHQVIVARKNGETLQTFATDKDRAILIQVLYLGSMWSWRNLTYLATRLSLMKM